MKNIKQISRVIIFTVITIFMLSCGTTTNIFDENVPLERTANIKFDNGLTLKSYNGVDVKPKTGALGMGYTGFTFPAGRATLIFDLDTGRQLSNVRYIAKEISKLYTILKPEKNT